MATKNRWDVIYETVDEQAHKIIPHFATQNVTWKTALMIKRNNKFVAMKICPTKLAPDAGDSAVSTSLVQASALSTSQAESAPTQRG